MSPEEAGIPKQAQLFNKLFVDRIRNLPGVRSVSAIELSTVVHVVDDDEPSPEFMRLQCSRQAEECTAKIAEEVANPSVEVEGGARMKFSSEERAVIDRFLKCQEKLAVLAELLGCVELEPGRVRMRCGTVEIVSENGQGYGTKIVVDGREMDKVKAASASVKDADHVWTVTLDFR